MRGRIWYRWIGPLKILSKLQIYPTIVSLTLLAVKCVVRAVVSACGVVRTGSGNASGHAVDWAWADGQKRNLGCLMLDAWCLVLGAWPMVLGRWMLHWWRNECEV
ncbi:hypothetical protein F4778DRAFT_189908 [Xylariomycetidae sp. FL2044]|nr:hypothetical protein F4778DRAFT_189908 [Xylariomycetidae sp. FL2044]